MSKGKKMTKKAGDYIGVIVMLLVGMLCGFNVGKLIGEGIKDGVNLWDYSFALILALYAAIFIHIVIHEAGHMIFGLASGYTFSSFRIGSFMWIRDEDNKIKFGRHSLAGTGGQCLMNPPEMVDGKFPVILYNLGGCIMNLLVAGICAVGCSLYKDYTYSYIVFLTMTLVGVGYAIINGIPMKMGMINNDGSNAWALRRNPVAMRAFWTQLKIAEQQNRGKRLKEMPDEWFEVPNDEDMKEDALVASIAVFHASWLMDNYRYEEASEYIDTLLSKETAIIGLHRNGLISERIFYELIGACNKETIEELRNKEYLQFVKQMKNSPSIIRTEYAYALLIEEQEAGAEKLMKQFEKAAKVYPYPRDIEGERELLALVDKAYSERK